MKKALSLILAALFAASALASCATLSGFESSSSAAVSSARAWLEDRLGDNVPDELIIDTADAADRYDVDMSDFEDDGYYIRAESGEVVILGATDAALDRAVRQYAKHGNPDDYSFTYHEGFRVKSLTVCGEDISAFAIVVDDDADECQLFAASELAKYVEKACGAKLATYAAADFDALGESAPKAIRLTVDYPALGDEAFKILVGEDGTSVGISGGRYRGCMYGVYGLLEDIGWRYVFSPVDTDGDVVEYLYESDHVDLTSAINREESPAIGYRTIWRGKVSYDVIDVKFRNFSHYADSAAPTSATYGDYGLTGIACHGLDANGWLAEMEEEGLYSGDPSSNQPCFTDPAVIEFVTEKALSYVEMRIAAGQKIGKEIVTIDVAQPDNGGFCRCKKCQEAIRYDGSDSGPVLRFTNAIAEALAEEYPGVNASMLAYAGTNVPTLRTTPLDNVRISYCIYVGQGQFTCSRHTVSGEECSSGGINNVKFGSELQGWADICSNNNLDVWYYPFDCYGTGFDSPITDQIFYSMKWLTSLGCVNGMMYHTGRATGTLLQALNAYVGSKLMWDGDMTKDEYNDIIKEWFDIIYGESAD